MGVDWTDVAQHIRGSSTDNDDSDDVTTGVVGTPTTWWAAAETAERRRARVRNCVCAMLCVFTAAAVLTLLGAALAMSRAPARTIHAVLERVQRAAAVQFAIEFNASSNAGRSRRSSAFGTDSVVRVNGSLIPRTSEDSGQLRFDGWVDVETSARERHELVLANHRGYQTVRALPLRTVLREGCVNTRDMPPLHALEEVPRSAFRADDVDVSAFGARCNIRGAAIELLVFDAPFVMCADELFAADSEAAGTNHTLVFHGERVVVRATVMDKWAAQREAPSVPSACRYLEAPVSTGRPKHSFLYRVLSPR